MRQYRVILIIFLCVSVIPLASQQVIKNPKKPLNPEAGRILRLQQTLIITDESGEFYFEYPQNLQTDSDGCLYIAESEQLFPFRHIWARDLPPGGRSLKMPWMQKITSFI